MIAIEKRVLVTQLMSIDESGNEEDQAEQASRQTKKRLRKGVMSSRPVPPGLPTWAVQA